LTIEQAFGNVIRKLRKERRLSQEMLAFNSMLDRSFISSLECGRKQPTLITIFQLADALNISASQILSDVELLLKYQNISIKQSINTSVKIYPEWRNILDTKSMESLHKYRGDETILLVDDEKCLLDMLGEFLKDFGYNVISATDGQHAVELFRENGERISLIVMDVVMPRLDGVKAYKEMLKQKADTNVVFMSAYPSDCFSDFDQKYKFIKKPLSPFDLIAVIRSCIDSSQAKTQ
jgi:CheY-like chemotaxis protein/DNA-binding XRE family transcriptional regulator